MFVEEAPISAIESSWPEAVAVCLATLTEAMAAMVGAALVAHTTVEAKEVEDTEGHRVMVEPLVEVVLLLAMAAEAAEAASHLVVPVHTAVATVFPVALGPWVKADQEARPLAAQGAASQVPAVATMAAVALRAATAVLAVVVVARLGRAHSPIRPSLPVTQAMEL